MITLEYVYVVLGLAFAAFAALSVADRGNRKRFGNAAFWGLFAASFLFGSHLNDFENGILVLALIAFGGFGLLGQASPRRHRRTNAACAPSVAATGFSCRRFSSRSSRSRAR